MTSGSSDFRVETSWVDDPGGRPSKKSKAVADHSDAVRYLKGTGLFLVWLGLIQWAFGKVPEVRRYPEVKSILSSLKPISFIRVEKGGAYSVSVAAVALIFAIVLFLVIAFTPLRHVPVFVWVPAGLVAISSLFVVLASIPMLPQAAPSCVIAMLVLLIFVLPVRTLSDSGPVKPFRIGYTPFVVTILTGVVPLAIGRAVANLEMTKMQPEDLVQDSVSQNAFALGCLLCLAMGSVFSLLPPLKGRNIAVPALVLGGSSLLAFAYLYPRLT